MPKSFLVGLLILFAGVAIAALNPLARLGRSYGPGWGDIVNGAIALALMLLGAIVALVGALRGRRRSP